MTQAADAPSRLKPSIEILIDRTGSDLMDTLGRVLDAVPDLPHGPQALARRFSIDKALASRVLRAVRSPDSMSAMHRIPGPEPLRKLLRAAAANGVDRTLITPAEAAVDRFAGLIRDDLGDRGALDAIVSAWVPEARKEFELRRKQSAFKAMSQLKGAQADAILATVMVRPSDDPGLLDLVWISGLIGLRRLRPGASVKLDTKRMTTLDDARRPTTLEGREIDEDQYAIIDAFSSAPRPEIKVHHVGETVHYTLDGSEFGPNAGQDLVLVEVNRRELPRYIGRGEDRQAFMNADASIPAKALQFDAIIHKSVYPGSDPKLAIYDTSFSGSASVNDRTRDMDRFDLLESIEHLGVSVKRIGSSIVPRYGQLIRHVCEKLGWDPDAFRAYRSRIDYPVYGTQTSMCFDVPVKD
jgi:hypothetical protein